MRFADGIKLRKYFTMFRIVRGKIRIESDDELLKRFRSEGNPEVFGRLYSKYMHLVYGVCLKYLKNRDDSKDAVMQIFEKLIAEIPKHNIENFRSWLHVVTKNYCLMQLRSDKTYEEKLNAWKNDQVIFMEYDTVLHPLDEDRDTISMEKNLEYCIERLNDEQKECIRKFYFDNMCYNEIAADLDIDVKKVKSCIQNGKRNLKICLEEKYVGKR